MYTLDQIKALCVITATGCWEFQGSRHPRGYGMIYGGQQNGRSKSVYVHQVTYVLVHGPIPEGFEIDHVCRNTRCCNPDKAHLEAVTHTENVKRGTAGLFWSQRTHCKNGHEFTPENIYRPPSNHHNARYCRACMNIASAKWREHVRWLASRQSQC